MELLPIISIRYPANSYGEDSNLFGRSCYLNLTPNSHIRPSSWKTLQQDQNVITPSYFYFENELFDIEKRKTSMRSTVTDIRLNHLFMQYIYREELDKVDVKLRLMKYFF